MGVLHPGPGPQRTVKQQICGVGVLEVAAATASGSALAPRAQVSPNPSKKLTACLVTAQGTTSKRLRLTFNLEDLIVAVKPQRHVRAPIERPIEPNADAADAWLGRVSEAATALAAARVGDQGNGTRRSKMRSSRYQDKPLRSLHHS